MWLLMPTQRMLRETELSAQRDPASPPAGDDVSISQVGTETIEDVATTKYKLIAKDGTAGAQDPQLFEVPAGYSKMPAFKGLAGILPLGALKAAVGR